MPVELSAHPSLGHFLLPDSAEVRARLAAGAALAPVSLPLTPFDATGQVDLDAFRLHLTSQLASRPGALIVCTGVGELASLSLDEYETLVGVAVETAAGQVPVLAGIGHRGGTEAEFARAAREAGADAGLLMLAPSTVRAPAGATSYAASLSAESRLPLMLGLGTGDRWSSRTVDELSRLPSVIGVLDGAGDLVHIQRLWLAAPADWVFVNAAPPAEIHARPYASVGITSSVSAVHAFAPEIAYSFFKGMQEGDGAWVEELLREFYLPLNDLTDAEPGYRVSVPKAAARLRGAAVGGVRPPLVDPAPAHLESLAELLEHGLRLVAPGW
ncbi:MAG: 5-dehydro-4-deoxyglucarate dehydratase [Marmoricola sp.]|nr:5-dehydro-4-deoxyglucarate dehydratase [Marmoricola sp.]